MDKTMIDHKVLLENIEKMILIMEFDGMRSPGKAKMNAANLVDMYKLKDIYTSIVNKKAPTKKEAK